MATESQQNNSTPAWQQGFARFGLVSKGVVYILLGTLAFMAAFEIGDADKDAGNKGVFGLILGQPFGQVLLGVVAVGLICYSAWRFIQALKDTEHKGDDRKGYGKRIAYFCSGLAYTILAFSAIRFLLKQDKSKSDQQQQLAGELLSKPFGQWLAGIVGVIIICVGLFQLYLAISGKFKKHVKENNLDQKAEKVVYRTGMLGYISRGAVWLIIGFLFSKAAFSKDAKQAGDTNRAFHWLEESSYGSYLLAIVAIGLICYGLFMFARARFQPVHLK